MFVPSNETQTMEGVALAETDAPQDETPRKRSKLPLLIGLVLAVLLGGGGFYAVFSGMILGPSEQDAAEVASGPMPDVTFVPIDAVTINLPAGGANRHLRFTAQLEVANPHAPEVTVLMPRILDVVNGYLRAVRTADLEAQNALVALRAQLLRRVQMVTGDGRVRDLLVTEFVLN